MNIFVQSRVANMPTFYPQAVNGSYPRLLPFSPKSTKLVKPMSYGTISTTPSSRCQSLSVSRVSCSSWWCQTHTHPFKSVVLFSVMRTCITIECCYLKFRLLHGLNTTYAYLPVKISIPLCAQVVLLIFQTVCSLSPLCNVVFSHPGILQTRLTCFSKHAGVMSSCGQVLADPES